MTPISLRPDYSVTDNRRRQSIIRGIVALARTQTNREAAEHARRQWSDDRQAIEVAEKAAVTPFMTTTAGASTHTSVSDLVSVLGPKRGAFAGIAAGAMPLSFNRDAAVVVPGVSAGATGISFIAQASPFPIRQLVFSGPTLTPMKIALGFGLTREMIESSNAVPFVDAAVRESVAVGLDTLFLDNVAASTTRPAGLRNGATSVSAATGGGVGALAVDLAALADAVTGIGGSDIVYCMSMKDFIRAKTLAPLAPVTIFPTSGVASGTVVAIALPGLAICGSTDAMRIEKSDQATVHFEDTSPAALFTSPGTFAAPIISAWQADVVVLRLICDITWAVRATGTVAVVSSITW